MRDLKTQMQLSIKQSKELDLKSIDIRLSPVVSTLQQKNKEF